MEKKAVADRPSDQERHHRDRIHQDSADQAADHNVSDAPDGAMSFFQVDILDIELFSWHDRSIEQVRRGIRFL